MTLTTTNSGLTLTQTDEITLQEYLAMRVKERHEKNKHIVYAHFPDVRSMNCMVYWGVFSWSIPSEKQRWLKKNSYVNVDGLTATPGDIVRDYLSYYHPARLRAIRAEALTYENQSSAPLYIKHSIIRSAMYIDISSTYFSIVCLLGWNVGYLPGKWLTPGRAPLDFPLPKDKAGRNYLVSIGLKTPMTIWTGYKLLYRTGQNAHTNRALWEVVQSILHSIAHTAISLGATYVHTDGYILPSKNSAQLMQYIKQWGLSPRIVAEGPAIISNFGNYQVGEKRTKHFDPSKPIKVAYDSIRTVDKDTLLSQVKAVIAHGTPQRLFEKSLSL